MNTKSRENALGFIRNAPKVELHAHLNGSLSQSTLQSLISLKKGKGIECSVDANYLIGESNNLSECFKQFSLIHDLTDSLEAVYMASCDVIQDFSKDGVSYLEIRTTPKERGVYMTRQTYTDTVLKAIHDTSQKLKGKIKTKLLLSFDRKDDVVAAEETLKLAEEYFTASSSVVGIDFSGDPTVGDVKKFIPLLTYAKKVGLKLAIHLAEVPSCDEEVCELLKVWPDRLGHGTFLHPKKGGCMKNFTLLQEQKIPLEFCLTSNVISKTVPSYKDHHFPLFREMNYPCVLCTDDKGIFNTSLSKEYLLAMEHFSLSESDVMQLIYNSYQYTFTTESFKKELQKEWRNIKRNV